VFKAHRLNRPDHWDGLCLTDQLLDNFHLYPVEQNGSDCRQAIHYTLCSVSPAGNCCHFEMKVVQQLTCLTAGLPNGLAYLTGELLNMPLVNHVF